MPQRALIHINKQFKAMPGIFISSVGSGRRRAHMGSFFYPGAQTAREPPRTVAPPGSTVLARKASPRADRHGEDKLKCKGAEFNTAYSIACEYFFN